MVWIACVLAAAGCGAASGTAAGPSIGDRAWWLFKSPHFLLRTDLDEAEARDIAIDLEQTYDVLWNVGFPLEKDPNLQTNVVVLSAEADYKRVGPKASNGFFLAEGLGEIDGATFIAYGGVARWGTARETFVHELTHRFVHYICPQAPLWLNEGLADYYETLVVDGDKLTLGRSRFAFKRQDMWASRTTGVLITEMPSLADLGMMERAAFYAGRAAPEGNEGKAARQKQAANYASAWATVALLQTRYRERLSQWIVKMAQGEPSQQAFGEAFASVDTLLDEERRALVEQLADKKLIVLTTTYAPGDIEKELAHKNADALARADVHILWARLLLWKGSEGLADARRHVDAALQLAPGSVDAHLLNASLLRAEGHPDGWLNETQETAAKHPDDERLALRLFRYYSHLRGGDKSAADSKAKVDALLVQWIPKAQASTTLNAFAWYMSLHGRADEAVSLAKRSIVLDPSCAYCFDTLALALFRSGEFKGAISAQEMSIGLLGEQDDALSELAGRLERFRKAWSAIVIWKKHPAPDQDPAVLPPAVIQAVRDAQQSHLVQCYEEGRKRDPELAGAVVIRAEITEDGKVKSAAAVPAEQWDVLEQKPSSPPLTDGTVIDCLLEQVGAFRFPASKEATKFSMPVTFKARKGAPALNRD